MKRLVATTGPASVAAAAVAGFDAGGNAIDALASAALAWPPSLACGGGMVVTGPGLGHGCCLFPARNPGFGLSRPRRSRLLQAKEPATFVAVPSVGKALAAMLTRWGSMGLPAVTKAAIKAAKESDAVPHRAALELLGQDGPHGFVRGVWGEEAARTLGPLSGGLLTRRDLIEARPELGEAFGPVSGLWLAPELDHDQPAVGATPAEQNVLYVVTVDGRGILAAMFLEAGPAVDLSPATVMGVEPNTLLSKHSPSQIKKVGQPVLLRHGVAVGGDELPTVAAGTLGELRSLLARNFEEDPPPGVLMMRSRGGRQLDIHGATFVEQP